MSKLTELRMPNGRNIRFVAEILAVTAMIAIVVTLGVVQYRWAGQLSQTERERLQSAVETSTRNFSQDFSYDFQQLCESFQLDMVGPAATLDSRLLQQYSGWSRASATPNLVADVHIWRADSGHERTLASYDEPSRSFFELPWPERLKPLHDYLMQEYASLPREIGDREAYYYPWTLYEETPALVRPLYQTVKGQHVEPAGFFIVELSGDFLSKLFLPDMFTRHFGAQSEFRVVVRTATAPMHVMYSSVPYAAESFQSPDQRVNLIEIVDEELRRRGGPGLRPDRPGAEWVLLAQHPAGSVESAVSALRLRNIGISVGLLAILAAGMGLIFEVARRATVLARQQMEFVAGVSHELCTPLAVINSAAENLMDGVIEGETGVKEYGGMIRDQGRRLEHLVDEVLQFAAGRAERTSYNLRPVDLAGVVAGSLSATEPMLRESGFHVEQDCPSTLPAVNADPAAVSMCLDNLISNAVKYAGGNRWLRVRAEVAAPFRQSPEVQITVRDRGMGIAEADLKQIFEPFYRVAAVREGEIRGVGLGLHLVKRAMEAMGGRVSVSSELGRGSCFTLHFPLSRTAEQPRGRAHERETEHHVQEATD